MYECVCVCLSVCLSVYLSVSVCVHACVCVYACVSRMHAHMHTYIHTHTHMHIHMHTHIHAHTHTHTHTYTCVYVRHIAYLDFVCSLLFPPCRVIVDGSGSATVFNGPTPLLDVLYTGANHFIAGIVNASIFLHTHLY